MVKTVYVAFILCVHYGTLVYASECANNARGLIHVLLSARLLSDKLAH